MPSAPLVQGSARPLGSKYIRDSSGSLRETVLTMNVGSSSLKFALFWIGRPWERRFHGSIDRIGLPGASLTVHHSGGEAAETRTIAVADHTAAATFLIDWLEEKSGFASVSVIGHRVVHGLQHFAPERVTDPLLEELARLGPIDPEHIPGELAFLSAFQLRYPALPQVVCYDTEFHRDLPRIAGILPIPRRYEAGGVRRYGFHGLSYAYLLEELERLGDSNARVGRVILAHLGNGSSLAAIRDGRSVDTSMGFTPSAGLMMGTRSGDLDPGLVDYLARTERMSPAQFQKMTNHESGLLGVSGTSSDMRELLSREHVDTAAAEAVAMYCYQVKKWIGSFAAVLGGLDTLVFAGGIGENCGPVRSRICDGLGFLGLQLKPVCTIDSVGLISAPQSRVNVRVIRTDEEQMIARSACRVMKFGTIDQAIRG